MSRFKAARPDHHGRGGPVARCAYRGVRERCRWEYAGEPFFEAAVEPCINGGTVALGAYFGENVDGIVTRLIGEQLQEVGRTAKPRTVRPGPRSIPRSESSGGPGVRASRRADPNQPCRGAGQEYLPTHSLFRRTSAKQVANADWLCYPLQWSYDVLRGLDYFRSVGGTPDPRLSEAVQQVYAKR